MLSSAKPGRSDQATGTHRLFAVLIALPGTGSPGTAGAAGRTTSSGGGSGVDAQAASIPTITSQGQKRNMLELFLEALFALLVFVFIVWWTMSSGRKGGEPPQDDDKPRD